MPPEKQLLDGVSGIWVSRKANGAWGEATMVPLGTGDLHLDGAAYASEDELWFCSARVGNYRSIDFWVSDIAEDGYTNIRNVGEELNAEVMVGELHITADGGRMYYHSEREGGLGGMDLWYIDREGDGWGEPVNVAEVNSPDSEGWPFVSLDGEELWITRWYMGTPGIFRSKLVGGAWSEPQLILGTFAGEPTLDTAGNVYFVHHFFEDGQMIEADIYVAYRKPAVEPTDDIEPHDGFLLGVLPNPAEGQSFEDAYREASEFTDLVPVWGRPSAFYEMPEELGGEWGSVFVDQLTRGNGMSPLIHLSFMDQGLTLKSPPGIANPSLSDPEWRRAYKRAAVEAVEAARPRYLSVGNEVNRWLEAHGMEGPNGFAHWVTLYEEIYDEVKELSPGTKVFCTFSREIVSENREADMGFLSLFDPDKMDLLAFTSYPHSVNGVNRPQDIPREYYSGAASMLPGRPVAFTEVAWPSHPSFGSEAAQAEFIRMIPGLVEGLDVEFVMWPWLHDLGEGDYTGLVTAGGVEKMGLAEWVAIRSTS
ncbi:hypothetical protein A3K81_04915 [Candidatus Bathyarchaeota archaeon RBG_13_60_20]|nr:MAG: hypothetical protein A3K81_04915 [Candidatus Bathyarchaeota archaeon RBG_13_60_20]